MEVLPAVREGVELAVVIGGGNFWRGRSSRNIDRSKADQIGMLATVMNALYVSEIFRSCGMRTEIFTPFACGGMTRLFSEDAAKEALAGAADQAAIDEGSPLGRQGRLFRRRHRPPLFLHRHRHRAARLGA